MRASQVIVSPESPPGSLEQLATIRTQMDQIYEDKLDGKIDDELWTRNQDKCREQERTLEARLSSLDVLVTSESVLKLERVFELANKAHSLYVTRNLAERGELLKSVLLELRDGRRKSMACLPKAFDLIFQHAKTEDWSALEDDFRTSL